MIVKIKSFKKAHFKKLLEYMMKQKDRLFDREGGSFAITHNLKGNTIKEWEKQYKENETHRNIHRKNSVILTHEILSWHKDDSKNISLDKMEKMAREYIEKRNKKGMYVAVPHFDKGHYHVHICASGLEHKTGKSLRMSRAEFTELKKEIQEYQIEKFPELKKSVVAHGGPHLTSPKKGEEKSVTEKEYQLKTRTRKETQKDLITAKLKTCYKMANSKKDFFEKLEESGLKLYKRAGRVTGVISNNVKHRFKRLGFNEDRLGELNKEQKRGNELGEIRNKGKEKTKERGRGK